MKVRVKETGEILEPSYIDNKVVIDAVEIIPAFTRVFKIEDVEITEDDERT